MNESTKSLSLTDDAPRVILAELPGDLHVAGTDSLDVSLVTDDDGATLELDPEGLVQVRSGSDLLLRLPAAASLEVRAVRGDARIQGSDRGGDASPLAQGTECPQPPLRRDGGPGHGA